MNSLAVQLHDDVLVVDSRLIAERLGIEHESLLRTINNYKNEIERFGELRLQIGVPDKPTGNPPRYFLLDEGQASFVMTLSRNTPEVVKCKSDLVASFSAAKKKLQETTAIPLPDQELLALNATVEAITGKPMSTAELIQAWEKKRKDEKRRKLKAVKEKTATAKLETESFLKMTAIADRLSEWASGKPRITVKEAIAYLGLKSTDKAVQMQVADAFRHLGYDCKRRRVDGVPTRVWELSLFDFNKLA